jgi:hypothetical protein
MGQNPDELAQLAQLKPAGITRNFSTLAQGNYP